jgi:hypothetical protein
MVHPYLRRRSGEEPISYPDDAIRKVLGKTLGVPLFQEQAMALAVVAAGFTPGQADELRRAIAAWKRQGNRIAQFGEALEGGMVARGYSRKFALQVFEQIKGFSGYGFPESHAASFALLVYASAWLKRHHPAAFAAALLNSQPMGFYAPAQILRDVRDHGVAVREVDIHCSKWDTTLERGLDLSRELSRELSRDLSRDLSRASTHAPARGMDGNSSDGTFGWGTAANAPRPRAVPRSSCRRTQQELDEGYIRMQVHHPVVRVAGAGRVESWSEGPPWSEGTRWSEGTPWSEVPPWNAGKHSNDDHAWSRSAVRCNGTESGRVEARDGVDPPNSRWWRLAGRPRYARRQRWCAPSQRSRQGLQRHRQCGFPCPSGPRLVIPTQRRAKAQKICLSARYCSGLQGASAAPVRRY